MMTRCESMNKTQVSSSNSSILHPPICHTIVSCANGLLSDSAAYGYRARRQRHFCIARTNLTSEWSPLCGGAASRAFPFAACTRLVPWCPSQAAETKQLRGRGLICCGSFFARKQITNSTCLQSHKNTHPSLVPATQEQNEYILVPDSQDTMCSFSSAADREHKTCLQ